MAPLWSRFSNKKVEMVQVPPYQKWSQRGIIFVPLRMKMVPPQWSQNSSSFQKRYCFQPYFSKRYTSWQRGTKTIPERGPSCRHGNFGLAGEPFWLNLFFFQCENAILTPKCHFGTLRHILDKPERTNLLQLVKMLKL